MRRTVLLLSLLILGCGGRTAEQPLPQATTTAPRSPREHLFPPSEVREPAAPLKEVALPPDLRTRSTGTDWPAFLGPTGDSKSPEKGIIAPWPKEGLKVVWTKKLGESYGMPTISRGRLFQFDRFGDEATLSCFKSETGEFLWKYTYPTAYEDHFGYNNGPRCSPVVEDDRVYIYGAEGQLHCVRVGDGQLVWKVDTKCEFGVVQNFFGVGSTPVIEGDLLIVQVGGSPKDAGRFPTLDQEGNGSGIVAFDKNTGKVRYQITDELASYAGPTLASINGRRWCFVFARGGLVGFEPASGKIDFHYPWRARSLECVNAANPVVVGDRVLISECYGPGSALLKVKPGGCDVVWTDADRGRAKALQAHWTTPVYHDGHVYGNSGRNTPEAELRCVELETGKVKWRERNLGHSALLMIDGHFICICEYGEVLLLRVNAEKFEEVSRLELKDPLGQPLLEYPAWAAPIVSHGLLYLRGKDRLVCLELIPAR